MYVVAHGSLEDHFCNECDPVFLNKDDDDDVLCARDSSRIWEAEDLKTGLPQTAGNRALLKCRLEADYCFFLSIENTAIL